MSPSLRTQSLNDSANTIHAESVIVDGLVFMSDGYTADLRAGNVAAINLTVTPFESDFATACDHVAVWLHRVSAPHSDWHIVKRAADIETARSAGKTGLIMGWQNMRPVEDQLHRISFFHALGVRIMQLTYNNRNFIGDGCLETDGGLSLFGRKLVREMNRVGIAIDLSHVGERTSLQALEISERPVLLTHANAYAVAPTPRNKSDDLIKAVAAKGGTIGVSIYGPMCWDRNPAHPPCLDDFLRHVDHIVDLVGVQSIAFGTDLPAVRDLKTVEEMLEFTRTRFPENVGLYEQSFGGGARERYVREIGNQRDLPLMTAALLDRGWSPADIKGLLGANLIRALQKAWID